MQEYVVNRPDEGAMERVLRKNSDNAAGVILRLGPGRRGCCGMRSSA